MNNGKKPRVTRKKHLSREARHRVAQGLGKSTVLCHSQTTCGRPLPLAGLSDQLPKNWDPPPVSPQLSSAL